MTLVGKADLEGDVGHRPVGLADQFPGPFDPSQHQESMRGDAQTLLEGACEMPVGQSGNPCKVAQLDRLGQVQLYVLANPAQHTRRKSTFGGGKWQSLVETLGSRMRQVHERQQFLAGHQEDPDVTPAAQDFRECAANERRHIDDLAGWFAAHGGRLRLSVAAHRVLSGNVRMACARQPRAINWPLRAICRCAPIWRQGQASYGKDRQFFPSRHRHSADSTCEMQRSGNDVSSGKSAMQSAPVPTLVLVHGAWTDGSSWSEVIARVQAAGVNAVSVQNPLSSLADDVASVLRAMELVEGPVILAGHSWGGTVITQAGMGKQVVGLVYVAAFAPDLGESTNQVQAAYPPPEYVDLLRLDSGGFLHFPRSDLPRFFAQDLPATNANVLAATQGPIRASAFDDAVTQAAWRSKPSWYLLTEHDRMIAPSLQRDMASRIGARVHSVSSSHVPFATRPKETAAILLEAVHSDLKPPFTANAAR